MKLAVLSESAADEAAVRVLVDAVLGVDTHAPGRLPLRSRGWPSVRQQLPVALRYLHYQTDTEALVVVADSDLGPVHVDEHDGEPEDACRLCVLRRTVAQVRLTPIPTRRPLKVAIGLAVPAIEAWYVAHVRPQVNEAAWIRGLRDRQLPYTRGQLKTWIYGTDRPSLDLERARAVAACTKAAEDIAALSARFPGFAALADALATW